MCVCVCVCVYMYVRQRDRQRETERDRDRERGTESNHGEKTTYLNEKYFRLTSLSIHFIYIYIYIYFSRYARQTATHEGIFKTLSNIYGGAFLITVSGFMQKFASLVFNKALNRPLSRICPTQQTNSLATIKSLCFKHCEIL